MRPAGGRDGAGVVENGSPGRGDVDGGFADAGGLPQRPLDVGRAPGAAHTGHGEFDADGVLCFPIFFHGSLPATSQSPATGSDVAGPASPAFPLRSRCRKGRGGAEAHERRDDEDRRQDGRHDRERALEDAGDQENGENGGRDEPDRLVRMTHVPLHANLLTVG